MSPPSAGERILEAPGAPWPPLTPRPGRGDRIQPSTRIDVSSQDDLAGARRERDEAHHAGQPNDGLTALADRLIQLNDELQRSNRDLELFAYVASHDLAEPLRAVSGYVQLLADRYRGRLDADADVFIDFAVDGVTRMQALIDDLLAHARVGFDAPPPVVVDCAALVAGVVAASQRAHPTAVFAIGPMPTLLTEPVPLRQVFENLLSNAVKFVPADRLPRVTLTAKKLGPAWRFTVADNGIGIGERHLERIFTMFERLHGRSDYPGTGIGLAICRRVVERLGGTLSVASTPAEGSEFSFTIPVAAADST